MWVLDAVDPKHIHDAIIYQVGYTQQVLTGSCTLSDQQIASRRGWSVGKVQQSMKRLRELNLVVRELHYGSGGTRLWIWTFPRGNLNTKIPHHDRVSPPQWGQIPHQDMVSHPTTMGSDTPSGYGPLKEEERSEESIKSKDGFFSHEGGGEENPPKPEPIEEPPVAAENPRAKLKEDKQLTLICEASSLAVKAGDFSWQSLISSNIEQIRGWFVDLEIPEGRHWETLEGAFLAAMAAAVKQNSEGKTPIRDRLRFLRRVFLQNVKNQVAYVPSQESPKSSSTASQAKLAEQEARQRQLEERSRINRNERDYPQGEAWKILGLKRPPAAKEPRAVPVSPTRGLGNAREPELVKV